MGFSVSSCLHQFPPLPTSITKSSPPATAQVGWAQAERTWKTQRAVGIACTILLGIEVGSLTIGAQAIPIAWDTQLPQESHVIDFKSKVERWSDKRSCPPWHLNSLETIVPENLPRPSARRRWEFIDFSKNHAPDQVVIKLTPQSNKCFSL